MSTFRGVDPPEFSLPANAQMEAPEAGTFKAPPKRRSSKKETLKSLPRLSEQLQS
jgi:hypothetical protein